MLRAVLQGAAQVLVQGPGRQYRATLPVWGVNGPATWELTSDPEATVPVLVRRRS